MATYTLISSNVLASSAASVTFSAIPATYTDLVLRVSARSDGATTSGALQIQPNSQTSGFSSTNIWGVDSAASSERKTAETQYVFRRSIPGTSMTSNTFGSAEVYIPNYAASNAKVLGAYLVTETNAALDAAINAFANLNTNTAAITSLTITCGYNFVSGSSFYLYGVSNA